MTYPDTPGYQAHSETSKEAADKLNAGTLRAEILDRIEIGGYFGRTADELSMQFDTPQSTIGARLRELELADQVIKTKMKRKTRYDRNAFVYVHPDHFKTVMGRATVKKAQNYDILVLATAIDGARKDLKTALEQHDAAHFEKCIRSALHKLNEAAKE